MPTCPHCGKHFIEKPYPLDAFAHRIGKEPDDRIAKEAGVKWATVRRYRDTRGIPLRESLADRIIAVVQKRGASRTSEIAHALGMKRGDSGYPNVMATTAHLATRGRLVRVAYGLYTLPDAAALAPNPKESP